MNGQERYNDADLSNHPLSSAVSSIRPRIVPLSLRFGTLKGLVLPTTGGDTRRIRIGSRAGQELSVNPPAVLSRAEAGPHHPAQTLFLHGSVRPVSSIRPTELTH